MLRCPDKDAHATPGPQLYDGKVDSWAVGILAYEVLVGRAPFEQESKQTTCDLICYGEYIMPSFISTDARDFIRKALNKNAAARPTIVDLLSHPWVAGEMTRRSSALLGSSRLLSTLRPHPATAMYAPSILRIHIRIPDFVVQPCRGPVTPTNKVSAGSGARKTRS